MATATAATAATTAAVEDDACRFCFEGPESGNPLVTPCKCIGSAKYVHVQCMKKWRRHTTNRDWMYKCQLCLEDYEIYLRWAKEEDPRQGSLLHLLTKRHLVVSVLLYYFHLTFLSLIPVTSPVFTTVPSTLTIHRIQEVKSPYSNLQYLYFTHISYYMYVALLTMVTSMYMYTYYTSFWKFIHNKKMYAYLWLSCITNSRRGILQTPLMTVFILIGSGMLSAAFISPFAVLYMYMLASVYDAHLTIIECINTNAEIF